MNPTPPSRVFISYSRRDVELARRSTEILRSLGHSIDSGKTSLATGEVWSDRLRELIAESDAVVFALGGQPSEWMTFELGAALAWSKPVIIVHSDTAVPFLRLLPQGKAIRTVGIEELERTARDVFKKIDSLDKSEIVALVEVYRESGVPFDRLVLQPGGLLQLSSRFERRTGRNVTPEMLAKELIRLRKTGALPRLVRKRSDPSQSAHRSSKKRT